MITFSAAAFWIDVMSGSTPQNRTPGEYFPAMKEAMFAQRKARSAARRNRLRSGWKAVVGRPYFCQQPSSQTGARIDQDGTERTRQSQSPCNQHQASGRTLAASAGRHRDRTPRSRCLCNDSDRRNLGRSSHVRTRIGHLPARACRARSTCGRGLAVNAETNRRSTGPSANPVDRGEAAQSPSANALEHLRSARPAPPSSLSGRPS